MDEFDGDASSILQADAGRLLRVKGVGESAARIITGWQDHFDLERELRLLGAHQLRFLTQQDETYPELLKQIYDPPIGLYWKGAYVVDRPCVAIVGTRRATLYGRSVAKSFASALARMGFCIVSGMARGTDTAAHEGALEAGGKTVAVFGCGMDIVYPPENLDLFKQIAEFGAVASEFPFGRRADRQSFPMRNRVVAGMCEAVIVIESDVAGGSMITARFAGEQGRQVMAVPGRIDQSSSAGCHQLIRDGATMVTGVDDILEELRYRRPVEMELPFEESSDARPNVELSEPEAKVFDLFKGGERLSSDAIGERLKMPSSTVSALLMGLELKRCLVKRADGLFEGVS
jgi:DNA processing protein